MVIQHSIIMIKHQSPLQSLNDPIHIHMPNAVQDLSWIYKSNLVEVNGMICVTISASDSQTAYEVFYKFCKEMCLHGGGKYLHFYK